MLTSTGTELILHGPVIGTLDVLVITELTNSVVPEAMVFRIFQDMRGVQATYRITPETTTTLLQSLELTDDIIYVDSVAGLTQPELENNIWGVITINGERIMYRELNVSNNTIIGLRRGTAGTGAADHAADSAVYDIGRGNLLPAEYQNYVVSQDFLANGTTTSFVATDISIIGLDSTELADAVEVYIGGILQLGGYVIDTADPVNVTFDVAPTQNYQVTILVKRVLLKKPLKGGFFKIIYKIYVKNH